VALVRPRLDLHFHDRARAAFEREHQVGDARVGKPRLYFHHRQRLARDGRRLGEERRQHALSALQEVRERARAVVLERVRR
jgi:hypothetical protein